METRSSCARRRSSPPPARAVVTVAVAVLLALTGCTASGARSRTDASADPAATKVLLLLDVSGSMNERLSSGGTKFDAAQRAVRDLTGSLPADTPVGLRVYGSEIATPQAQNPRACRDTRRVLPVQAQNADDVERAVDSFQAQGETPIAYALEQAVEDLGGTGRRIVVLVSDGEETCGEDPCATARELTEDGVELSFYAVGLAVDRSAREQLNCVVEAGGGAYYDASDADQLSNAIFTATRRGLRPIALGGYPVAGSQARADAPILAPGDYQDTFDRTRAPRHYRLERSVPGSTLTASVASIGEPDRGEAADRWQLDLTTLDGTPCSSASTATAETAAATVVAGAVRSSDVARATASAADSPCQTDTSLLLAVTRFGTGADAPTSVPAELVVREELPVTNLAELPEGLPEYDGRAPVVPASTEVRPVRGSTAFSGATGLLEGSTEPRAGSFSDDLAAGETAFYRVHLEAGQRLRATARVPGESAYALRDGERVRPVLLLHAPSRLELTRQSATATADQVATLTAATPEVRIRNRETGWTVDGQPTPLGAASVPGEYYVAVQLEPSTRRLGGRVVPIQLNVSVDGTPSGAAEHGSGSGQTAPDAEPNQRARATSATLLVLALLIGAAANGVWLARRRDRRPR